MPRSYWGYWFHPVITWPFVDFVQVNVICHFSLVLTPMMSRSKVYIRFNDNVIISCDIRSTTRQFQEQWNINDQIIRQQQKSWWWKGWFLKRSMMPTGNSYWTYSDLFSSRCKEMQSFITFEQTCLSITFKMDDKNINNHIGKERQKKHNSSFTRMATENSVSDDNRTAVGQVKSVRRVPVSRSTMVKFYVGWKSTHFFAIEIVLEWKELAQPTRSQFWNFLEE